MLTIGALVLFMVAVLNANRVIVSSDSQALKSEQYVEAAAIARSIFGELRLKSFDQNATDSSVLTPVAFTSPALLGREATEVFSLPETGAFKSPSKYNDIDDYNNYTRKVPVSTSAYDVLVRVYYVKESDYSPSTTATYLKQIDVTVVTGDSLRFSTIQSYY